MKAAFPHAARAGSLLWGWQCHSSICALCQHCCSPEVLEKRPPTMAQLLPPPALCQAGSGQHVEVVMGLHPTLQSCVLPGASLLGLCLFVTSLWPLLFLVCQLRLSVQVVIPG